MLLSIPDNTLISSGKCKALSIFYITQSWKHLSRVHLFLVCFSQRPNLCRPPFIIIRRFQNKRNSLQARITDHPYQCFQPDPALADPCMAVFVAAKIVQAVI